jgi:hypothetical protein
MKCPACNNNIIGIRNMELHKRRCKKHIQKTKIDSYNKALSCETLGEAIGILSEA